MFRLFLSSIANKLHISAFQVPDILDEIMIVPEQLPLFQQSFIFGKYILLVCFDSVKTGSASFKELPIPRSTARGTDFNELLLHHALTIDE